MSDINELREHLFATLRGIQDGSVDVDRARAVSDIAQTLINTAKVEIDYLRATGRDTGTGFVPVDTARHAIGHKTDTHTGTKIQTETGVVHRMR